MSEELLRLEGSWGGDLALGRVVRYVSQVASVKRGSRAVACTRRFSRHSSSPADDQSTPPRRYRAQSTLRTLADPLADRAVTAAYGISWAYLIGDVGFTTYKARELGPSPLEAANMSEPTRLAMVAVKRSVFQGVASMALPAFTIHTAVKQTSKALINSKNVTMKRWAPTAVGIGIVPALPYLFDHPVSPPFPSAPHPSSPLVPYVAPACIRHTQTLTPRRSRKPSMSHSKKSRRHGLAKTTQTCLYRVMSLARCQSGTCEMHRMSRPLLLTDTVVDARLTRSRMYR